MVRGFVFMGVASVVSAGFRLALVGMLGVVTAACGSRGTVTFQIDAPLNSVLNPLTDRVTEYTIKRSDGMLIGVASENPLREGDLAVGALPEIATPTDLVINVLSGSDLLGLGRVRDVTIMRGKQENLVIPLRRLLMTVGASKAPEDPSGNLVAGQILDGATLRNLSLATPDPTLPLPKLPDATTAAAATSDGRFLILGSAAGLSVLDTSTGMLSKSAQLPFTPARIAVGPRDSGVAVLDAAGGLYLFGSVAELVSSPTSARPTHIDLGASKPRRAAFAADGASVYVLDGAGVDDPCIGPTPTANKVRSFGLDGSPGATFSLNGFASDLVVNPVTGQILIADVTNKQVSALNPAATATPAVKVLAATCPSALSLVGNDLYVVTAEPSGELANAYVMKRTTLGSGIVSSIAFPGPQLEIPTEQAMSTSNIRLSYQVQPSSLVGYELALTPDGTRAVFATRALYRATKTPLTLLGIDCTADFDVVEYGVYQLDTRSGNSNYVSRSQIITRSAANSVCITCPLDPVTDLVIACVPKPGDRASGLVALFGAP